MRVIVTGLVATYPVGGVAWDYLQYVQAFHALGCDVHYLEDTGQWVYDPAAQTFLQPVSQTFTKLGGTILKTVIVTPDQIPDDVTIQVDTNGSPSNIRIVRGLRPDLDDNAIAAVRKYKFNPALKDGVPVTFELNVEVNYLVF